MKRRKLLVHLAVALVWLLVWEAGAPAGICFAGEGEAGPLTVPDGEVPTRVEPEIFSPNGDGFLETAVFGWAAPFAIEDVRVVVRAGGVELLELYRGEADCRELSWDGQVGGEPVADGPYAFHLVAKSVQQTRDGGYVLAGHTASLGGGQNDAWVLKTDAEGREVWSRVFGGPQFEGAWCVLEIPDGEYVVAGHTESLDAVTRDGWLMVFAVTFGCVVAGSDGSGELAWGRKGPGWPARAARPALPV